MRYAAGGRDGVEIQNRYRLFTKLLCQTQWIFNNYKNLRGTNTVPLEQLCLCSPIINLDSNNILISNNSDSFFSCCSVAWACFYSSPERINGSRDVTFLCFYRPIIITNPICNMFWSFISMAVGANSQSLLALWYVKIIHTKISGASPGQQLFWCLYPREGQAFRTLIVLCQCVAHFIQHRSLLNSYTAMLPKMFYKWVVSMGITRPRLPRTLIPKI